MRLQIIMRVSEKKVERTRVHLQKTNADPDQPCPQSVIHRDMGECGEGVHGGSRVGRHRSPRKRRTRAPERRGGEVIGAPLSEEATDEHI